MDDRRTLDETDVWLSQVEEEVLEPELEICDPHHHLWSTEGQRYMLEEYLEDLTGGHRVTSTVYVDCMSGYFGSGPDYMRPVGETRFAESVANEAASHSSGFKVCAAIVGHADCCRGSDVGEVLDAHIAASPRFRGIRQASNWDSHADVRNSHTGSFPGMLADANFREGFTEIGKRNLSFDAWLYHHQIPELTALARAFPETVIVFDHFGGPLGIGPYTGRQAELFPQWCEDVKELATCENVYAKLGGIQMPVNGYGFHKRELPPTSDDILAEVGQYYRYTLDCFGAERCMFESNFPVDKKSCSYTVLWNAFKKLCVGASAEEKAALFRETALAVYRIQQ